MLENLMIASIFITMMMTLIVLGLLVLAVFYFAMDYIHNNRRRKARYSVRKSRIERGSRKSNEWYSNYSRALVLKNKGYTNAKIGEILGVSENTVRGYLNYGEDNT